MESAVTFFTDLSPLEQASLSGGVTVVSVGGNAIAGPGETVIGSPGESSTVVGFSELSETDEKRSKANEKSLKESFKLKEKFD